MSYEPHLVINADDLVKKAELFCYSMQLKWSKKDKDVMEYLDIVRQYQPIHISGVNMIICHPELTSFNKRVREKLYDWDVEFAEWD